MGAAGSGGGTLSVVPGSREITLLFTDIEGSTRLWEREPDRMSVALARHDTVVRDAIEGAGGAVFKGGGDGLCAVFEDPLAGVQAAVTIQRCISEVGVDGVPLRVRVALHRGVCEERDADYFGPAVNRVARLMSTAHGGQTIVSERMCEALEGRIPSQIQLLDLGQHRLKDLLEPERVFQVVSAGLPRDFPPLRSLGDPALRHNLPLVVSSLTGRERELDEIRQLVSACRLVTVTATGGIGKTRVALQVGADMVDGRGDGVWFVDLAAVVTGAGVATTTAQAVGLKEEVALDGVVDALRDRRLLLILDNCEHVIDDAAELALAVLSRCPHVDILATSREPLRIDGERVYRLPPLDARTAGVELFMARARDHDVHLEATPAVTDTVASICERVDGMPLAIELAAGRLQALGLDELDRRLDQRFRILRRGSRGRAPRQQTLENVIDWSYRLLSPDEADAFRKLSVFRGGWDLEAAEMMCFDATREADPIDVLASLWDKSLLQIDPKREPPRYGMLVSIREFAAARLDRDEADHLRDRHVEYYRQMAQSAEPQLLGRDAGRWLRRLEDEQDNFGAALEHCVEQGDIATGASIAWSLRDYWMMSARFAEGRRWIERLLTLPHADVPGPARAELQAAWLRLSAASVRQPEAVIARGDEVLALATEYLDGRAVAQTLWAVAHAYETIGHSSDTYYDQALELARRLSDIQLEAEILQVRTNGMHLRGEDSEELLAAVARGFDQVGCVWGFIGAEVNLGELRVLQGRVSEARAHFKRGEAAARELGLTSALLVSLSNDGYAAHLQGDKQGSAERFEHALNIAWRHDHRLVVAYALLGAAVAAADSDAQTASALIGATDRALRIGGHKAERIEAGVRRDAEHRLRTMLGDQTYETEYDRGANLSAVDAYQLARAVLRHARVDHIGAPTRA